jgi:uncharacterized protein (DUF927 family)
MNAMLEKNTDTPILLGYSGYSGYKTTEASNSNGLEGVDAVTNDELVTGYSGYKPEKTDEIAHETLVSPIPDDAPLPLKRFNSITVDGKKVDCSASWSYRDAQNKVLFHILRFDSSDGKKEFRPLTLWNTSKGLMWKNKGMPKPRPLYGLDRLAAMPDAEVMVCEGEKSADAACLLFPRMVAIACLNGAKSPHKNDWSPLGGRSVYLWQDNDQPGIDFIAEVERLATEAGATVKQAVRPDWFRQMSKEVGTACNELPVGWDAADALADGFTAENIQALLEKENGLHGDNTLFMHAPSQAAEVKKSTDGNAQAAKEKDDEAEAKRAKANELFKDSEFAVIEFTKGYKNGVYWQEPFAEDAEPKAPARICSPLIVLADTRNDVQGEWGRLLVWKDNDGHGHTWACPVRNLEINGILEVRQELAENGLSYIASSPKLQQKLKEYISSSKPQSPDRLRCVTKTGWHEGRYVLPGQVFGKTEGEGVIFQGSTVSDFATSGTLADWQREIAGRAVGNSRILFSIACAFAGPLVEMANESGGGFQFTGETSKGKTSTLMDPSASVWGNPDRFAKKWRTTTNGLEALCLSRNDSILILDDLGQADAKECGQAAYLIANGQGKARMQKEGGNRPLTTWKTFLLSSGEIDLSQHMSEAGKTARGGQVARLPSIPADAGAGHYVIEHLHGLPDGRQFADTMKAVSRKFYGTAGAAFMEALTDPVMLKEIRETIREGITEIVSLLRVPKEAAPEVERIAARFALVAFAGELATRFGVTGWKPRDAFMAALRCFNDWLSESGGAMGADEKALFAQVSAFLQAHGASRFPDHEIDAENLKRVLNRAGFSCQTDEGVSYWAESGTFSKDLCKGFNPTTAAKSLIKAKWMEPGTSRKHTQQKRIRSIGKNGVWLYIFTPAAMGVEE